MTAQYEYRVDGDTSEWMPSNCGPAWESVLDGALSLTGVTEVAFRYADTITIRYRRKQEDQ